LKNIKNFNTIQNDMDIRTKVKELNNQKLLKEKLKLNINLNNKNLGKIFNIKSNNRNSKKDLDEENYKVNINKHFKFFEFN
jgi:hypothetical protein